MVPASRIKADTLNIFFNNQKAGSNSENKLQKAYVLATFSLELLYRYTFCNFGRAF